MRSCNDQVRATFSSNSGKTVRRVIKDSICINSLLCWGKHSAYTIVTEHKFNCVHHSTKQLVADNVLAYGVENIRAVFRRCVLEVYCKISPKHLKLYLTEVYFGFTSGDVKYHTRICIEVPI